MPDFIIAFKKAIQAPVAQTTWGVLIIVLSVTGPFGAYAASPLWLRAVLATPIVVVSALLGTLIRVCVNLRWPQWSFLRATTVVTLASVVLLTPPVYAVLMLLAKAGRMDVPELDELCLLVASMTLALSALRNMAADAAVDEAGASSEPIAPEPPKPLEVRLLQRIDPELRGNLLAISVRDHYVDVQTSAGNTSLLLRLGDAMAEADPIEGSQLHRSHWVAWDAIEAVEAEAGKLFVRLLNGNRVPVSKNHREKLRERELL